MTALSALYPEWARINDVEMVRAKSASRMRSELGIANHHSATAYMLYHTIYITIVQMRSSLNPSTSDKQLCNEAAEKIAVCLELKEREVRQGMEKSNTIGFMATKVAWQALGGFDAPEGRRLARAMQTPWEESAITGHTWPGPIDPGVVKLATWAQASSRIPTVMSTIPHTYHLPRHESQPSPFELLSSNTAGHLISKIVENAR